MKKIGLLILLMASIAVMLMLSVGIAMANVNTTTQGGQEPAEGWTNVKGRPQQGGVIIRDHIKKFHQNKFKPFATDLHFKVWQKEDNIEVRGWQIKITGFTNSNSQRGKQPPKWHNRVDNMPGLPTTDKPDNGKHAIDVTADGANVPYCKRIEIEIIWWLTSRNTKHIYNVTRD